MNLQIMEEMSMLTIDTLKDLKIFSFDLITF